MYGYNTFAYQIDLASKLIYTNLYLILWQKLPNDIWWRLDKGACFCHDSSLFDRHWQSAKILITLADRLNMCSTVFPKVRLSLQDILPDQNRFSRPKSFVIILSNKFILMLLDTLFISPLPPAPVPLLYNILSVSGRSRVCFPGKSNHYIKLYI